jgi:hypothetical protein
VVIFVDHCGDDGFPADGSQIGHVSVRRQRPAAQVADTLATVCNITIADHGLARVPA